jgi:uncharacterized delta-60 repeat protein
MNLYNVPGIEKYKPRKVLVGIIQNFPWIGGVTMGKVVALLWIALILSALITFPGTAKAEDTNWWMKTYGGSRDDRATAVALAPNGDIIVVGNTRDPGVGSDDALVLRLDGRGNVKWEKVYGGGDYDRANAVAVAPNGDIIIAGETKSFGAGNTDAWVLRLDENGDVKWGKTYGGSDNDGASGVAIAPNGDIIVVGDTKSFGAGGYDLWVLRLNGEGNVRWEKTYGGKYGEEARAITLADNGDVIVAGYTDSFGVGDKDVWVLRLPPDGNLPGCRFSYNSNSQVSEPTPNIEDSNAEIHESHAEVKYSNAHPNPGTPTVKTQCAHSKSKVPLSPKAVGAIAATGVAVIAIYKGIKR